MTTRSTLLSCSLVTLLACGGGSDDDSPTGGTGGAGATGGGAVAAGNGGVGGGKGGAGTGAQGGAAGTSAAGGASAQGGTTAAGGNAAAGASGKGNGGTGTAGKGAASGAGGKAAAGNGNAGSGTAGKGNAGSGASNAGGSGAAGNGNAGSGTAGNGNAGNGNAGNGNAGNGNAGTGAGASGGGTTKASCKRGIAYGENGASDLAALSPGISWWYNWSPTPEKAVASSYAGLGVEFVPMVWGNSFTVADVVAKIPDGAKYLLTFNEPNFFSQANMTPEQAAARWPEIEDIAKQRNLAIVSPALNYCGGGCNETDPYVWLDKFFAACPSCKVDYVAMHWYACSKDALTQHVAMYEKYGRPVWVTEFSCLDSSAITEPLEESYQQDALTALEADPKVFRYSWFTGRFDGQHAIDLLGDAGKLTPLGKQYVGWPGCQ